MSAVGGVDSASNSKSDTASRIPTKTMTQTDFLKVLVAQYSNQIPTDAASSTEFYKNMMDLSNYQAIQDVSTKMSSMSAEQMIGQYVSATNDDGDKITGTISAATYDGTNWYYLVGDQEFKPSQITKITTAPATTSSN